MKKYNCRKIVNIRNNTIFQIFSHTPMSILINSIEQFICEDKNASKTIEFLRERYQLSAIEQKTIYNLFMVIRKCISQYYFDVYQI